MAGSAVAGRVFLVGGGGSQTLVGGAGADSLVGGFAHPDDAFTVLHQIRGGGLTAGPASSAGAAGPAGVHLYGAGAAAGSGGVGGWTLHDDGRLAPVFSQVAVFYDLDDLMTGAPALAISRFDGANYLITGGFGVSLSRLDAGGAPELLETVHVDWDSGLTMPGAFATYEVRGVLHILVGGGWDGGLTVLRWDAFGLRVMGRVEDRAGLPLAGVADLAVASVGARTFAVAASHGDSGLSVWELGAGAPVMRDWRGVGDGESGLDMARARSVEAVSRGAEVWVYAAAADGALVSYRLGADGGLARFASQREGATGLAAFRLEGRDFLAVARGGRDLEVFEIAEGGRLDLFDMFRLGPRARLGDVSVTVDGDRAVLVASRLDAGGHDVLQFGIDAADMLRGRGGDDLLRGDGGDDRLWGDGGDDRLWGGAGDDRLWGEAGDDWLWGGAGADWLWGGVGNDRLHGGGGADVLHGEGGDDALYGGAGADRLFGGAGADDLDGGGGADALFGGGGADRLRGRAGNDQLSSGAGADSLWGGGGKDRLDGGGGADRLWGGNGADVLFGRTGADELFGGGGADRLFGGGGADRLFGGGGADRLWGGGGSDRLVGGPGADTLRGGGGADVFEFAPRHGVNVIKDFRPDIDHLRLLGADGMGDILLRASGGEATIRHGKTWITLEGVAPRELDAGDFLFG